MAPHRFREPKGRYVGWASVAELADPAALSVPAPAAEMR